MHKTVHKSLHKTLHKTLHKSRFLRKPFKRWELLGRCPPRGHKHTTASFLERGNQRPLVLLMVLHVVGAALTPGPSPWYLYQRMNVRLTPELQTLVQTKVKAGFYLSANDLVCEAVRLLDRRDRAGRRRLREIREQIDEGWFSLRNGEGVDGEEFFPSLERREKVLIQKRKGT